MAAAGTSKTVTPMAKYKLVFLGDQSVRARPTACRAPLFFSAHSLCLAALGPAAWLAAALCPCPRSESRALSPFSSPRRLARRRSSRGSCTTSLTATTRCVSCRAPSPRPDSRCARSPLTQRWVLCRRRRSGSISCRKRCTSRTGQCAYSCGTPPGRSASDLSSPGAPPHSRANRRHQPTRTCRRLQQPANLAARCFVQLYPGLISGRGRV